MEAQKHKTTLQTLKRLRPFGRFWRQFWHVVGRESDFHRASGKSQKFSRNSPGVLQRLLQEGYWGRSKGVMGRDAIVHKRQRNSSHKKLVVRHFPLIFIVGMRRNNYCVTFRDPFFSDPNTPSLKTSPKLLSLWNSGAMQRFCRSSLDFRRSSLDFRRSSLDLPRTSRILSRG